MADASVPVPGITRQVVSATPNEVEGCPFYVSYNHDFSRTLQAHYADLGYSLAIFEDDPVNQGEHITVSPHAEVSPLSRRRREWRELREAERKDAAKK